MRADLSKLDLSTQQGQMVDHMGNQVLGVPQMHLSMDAEQLRQLGYDPETIQVSSLIRLDLILSLPQVIDEQGTLVD